MATAEVGDDRRTNAETLLTPDQIARIQANRRQGASCPLRAYALRSVLHIVGFPTNKINMGVDVDTFQLNVQRSSGARSDLPHAQ